MGQKYGYDKAMNLGFRLDAFKIFISFVANFLLLRWQNESEHYHEGDRHHFIAFRYVIVLLLADTCSGLYCTSLHWCSF